MDRSSALVFARNLARLALVVAAGCFAGCAVDRGPDDADADGTEGEEDLGVATEELVPCLSTDETLSYPSTYVLTNVDDSPLVPGQDITLALQAAIDEQALTLAPEKPVIVIPVGTFSINKTIRIRASWSTQIVGATSPSGALPTIRWDGPADDDMFFVDWAWWTRFNRLVLDGNGKARIGLHFMESKQRVDMNAATDRATTSYPLLDGTPMMPYQTAPAGLDTSVVYWFHQDGPSSYYLSDSRVCPQFPADPTCSVDLVDSDTTLFIVGSGFNSYDHEITDVSFRSMKYGVVGGAYTMDYEAPYPGVVTCPTNNIDGVNDWRCVALGEPGLMDTGSDVGTVNIRRSTFSWIGEQGVVANTYNVIDWGIFDSTFESSKIGVFIGVGQASIFNSRFRLNTTRDISVGTWGYTTIRDNVSVASNQFLKTHRGEYTATIINNKVAGGAPDPQPAMALENRTITVLDNQIMTSKPPFAFLDGAGLKGIDIVHGNNITSQAITFPSAPVARTVQVEPNATGNLTINWPPQPPVATWRNRPTTEVTADGNGRCCVFGLCDECGTKLAAPADGSAFHLAAGTYKLNKPITIPANRDVLVYGDGLATKLVWVRPNTAYVAPGVVGQTATVFFDLVGSSRASIREMALLLDPDLAPDRGYAGGISIRSTDAPGNRVYVDETKISDAKYGVDANGYDNLATRLDMVAIGPAEVPLRAKGKGAGAQGGSNATKGILAFSGEYNALADAFRVEDFGKLVSQGADLEGGTQGAIMGGSGFVTVSSSRIFAANAAWRGCDLGLPVSYPQHANYGIASTFQGRALFADMWTTGRFVGNLGATPAGQMLAINVGNNVIHEPDPLDPKSPECGGHEYLPPESIYPFPAEPVCFAGASDEIPTTCPFSSLSPAGVASGKQANINGRFLYPKSGCNVACKAEKNLAAGYLPTMYTDLRAAKSSAPPTQCGPTDVRIRRVFTQGRGVGYDVNAAGYDDWRLMEYGIRIQ